jgi:hypothetical protein
VTHAKPSSGSVRKGFPARIHMLFFAATHFRDVKAESGQRNTHASESGKAAQNHCVYANREEVRVALKRLNIQAKQRSPRLIWPS